MRKLLLDVMAAAEEPPPLCRRIREARERLGISQEEAAHRLHLSLKGYTAYELFREPKPARAREIAVAFGQPADHFETQPFAAGAPKEDQLRALREELAEVRRMVAELLDRARAA